MFYNLCLKNILIHCIGYLFTFSKPSTSTLYEIFAHSVKKKNKKIPRLQNLLCSVLCELSRRLHRHRLRNTIRLIIPMLYMFSMWKLALFQVCSTSFFLPSHTPNSTLFPPLLYTFSTIAQTHTHKTHFSNSVYIHNYNAEPTLTQTFKTRNVCS